MEKQNNLIKDISILTTIPEKVLFKLEDKACICINDAVAEMLLAHETICKITFILGDLYIQILDNEIKYKFIPSSKLENSIKQTVIEGKSMLEKILEDTLVQKITSTYKDLF